MNESAFNAGSETAHLVLSASHSVQRASCVAGTYAVKAAKSTSEVLVSYFAGFKAALALRT